MHWHVDAALNRAARSVAELAITRNVRLATAESCTGGLIAHLLTRTSGISPVLMGGVVAYSNEAKHDLLAVPSDLLSSFGAVSEPVALAMARGARALLHADLAVSTTGVAGPGGGSVGKPVGLIFVAASGPRVDVCLRFLFDGDRADNVMAGTLEALKLLESSLYTETT